MSLFRLTLYFASGEVQTAELQEGLYSAGSGASDQIQLLGEGIGESHLQLTLLADRVHIEPTDFGLVVNVNGHSIEGLVEAEYPASVELQGITLVLESVGLSQHSKNRRLSYLKHKPSS